MKTLKFFCCLAVLFLFLTGCQKKEKKTPPRCIYDHAVFAEAALKAAHDETHFLRFKQDPFFNLLWENLSPEEGAEYFHQIQQKYPSFLTKWENFRQLDALGTPRVYPFSDAGLISPSTLRLAVIAGDLYARFGGLPPLKVVQIGAGQGGLCKIFHDLFSVQSFTIVDLPEQLAIAKKCLEKLGVGNVVFLTPEELSQKMPCDLVLSDLSFSEFNSDYQRLFFERILAHSSRGYLLGHVFPKHYGVTSWSFAEVKKNFEKSGKFSEWELLEPSIESENYFVCWNR